MSKLPRDSNGSRTSTGAVAVFVSVVGVAGVFVAGVGG